MKITPLSNKVVLKLKEASEITAGGILLPQSAQEEANLAVVVAVGPGKINENGTLVPVSVKENDTVLIGNPRGYDKTIGEDITLNGQNYKIVNDTDILAVLN